MVKTLPAEKKRRRLPLPLFVLIGLESTAFVAVGIAAEPWSVLSLSDIPVTLAAVGVALLVILSMTWKAARKEMREARVAEELARVAEELVSLEDLHQRIQLYVPTHTDVEAPRRDLASHALTDAGIHTREAPAAWAASFRQRVGLPSAEPAAFAMAARATAGVPITVETPAAPVGQVTSDPDEDVARWRNAALALVAEAPAEAPPPATLELGWKVPSITTTPDPISRTPEAIWAVAESRIRAVMPEISTDAEGTPADDASSSPTSAEAWAFDAVRTTADADQTTARAADGEPAPTTFFELPAPGDVVITEIDLSSLELMVERAVAADPLTASAEPVVASVEPVVASVEPVVASVEPVVGPEPEAVARSLEDPIGAQSEEAPELKALVRALDALRPMAPVAASAPLVSAGNGDVPAESEILAADASSTATDGSGVSSFRTGAAWEPAVAEVDELVTNDSGSRANTPTPDGRATAPLNSPSSKSSFAANTDSLGSTASRRGGVRRRRAFRRRAGAREDGAGETERSITLLPPSRSRDGAEVRLRLDLDGDGLAALLHALEQLKSEDVPGQPGLVVIPGGKAAPRAN